MHFMRFKAFPLVWLYGCVHFSLCYISTFQLLLPPFSLPAEVWQGLGTGCQPGAVGAAGTCHSSKYLENCLSPCEHSAVRWVGCRCVTRRWQTSPGSQILSFQLCRQSGNHFFINSKYTESCPDRFSSLIPGGDENRFSWLNFEVSLVCLLSGCARSHNWGSGPWIR